MPSATSSGFTRPSRAGPRELNDAMICALLTAPTLTMSLALPVMPMVVNAVYVSCFTVSHPPVQISVGQSLPLPLAERSEEHTSELQSHLNLVCRLLLE